MPKKALKTIAAAAIFVASLALVSPAPSAPGARAVSYDSLERAVLAEVNALRRSRGLSFLRLSDSLTRAADQHSAEMARLGYFAHESADGSAFDRRVARYYSWTKSRYWSVGENLLWSSPGVDAAGALRLWLNSPPHRKNLLTARWREIGLSAVHVESGPGSYGGLPVTILTADFGVRR
jgi:uncharacterized protein YkwD